MDFVMSYSCGKDSTLALHKMLEQGHRPVGLLVMFHEAQSRSFFHGADRSMLERYSQALDLPLILCPATGEEYHLAMEAGLAQAKEMGAVAACFGDIDLEENRAWSELRCKNAGLKAVFPLWHRDRRDNVKELLDTGYRCLIKSVDRRLLPETLLGRCIDEETVRIMEEHGVDVCGENGEYHTLTVDGPIFKTPLDYEMGAVLNFGDFSVIEVR